MIKPKDQDDLKRMAAQALRTAEQVLSRIRQTIEPGTSADKPEPPKEDSAE
jgi:hypothetical protein